MPTINSAVCADLKYTLPAPCVLEGDDDEHHGHHMVAQYDNRRLDTSWPDCYVDSINLQHEMSHTLHQQKHTCTGAASGGQGGTAPDVLAPAHPGCRHW
jgi:hypothetical protein